jgi:Predicted integral membrane protein (DUF2269)
MKSTLIKLPLIASLLLCVAWVLGQVVPSYTVLKLLHVFAFITLGAGLVGVLVTDLRARMSTRFDLLVESIETMLMFYYRVVMPGSLLILLSGFSMVFGHYGIKALEIPWLAGMMVLFVFEFFEGHLIMKFHYLKLAQGVQRAKQAGGPVPELDKELRARLTLATHFLDVPNFALIVTLGIVRPTDWTLFYVGIALVIGITAWMAIVVPRRFPWLKTPSPHATLTVA